MLNYFIFLLSLCFSLSLSAQDPSHFIIGADELSNVDIYDLFYDDRTDILYAGTNRGVYKYTQSKFTELKGHKDQIGDSFFHLQKDKKGEIYCSNLNGQIFKLTEDSVSLFHQSTKSEYSRIFSFFFDNDNNLITSSFYVIRKISPTGKETVLYDSREINSLKPNNTLSTTIQAMTYFKNGTAYFYLNEHNGDYLVYAHGEINAGEIPINHRLEKPIFFSLGEAIFLKADTDTYNLTTGQLDNSKINWNKYAALFEYNDEYIIERSNSSGIRFLKCKNGNIEALKESFQDHFISAIAKNGQNTLFLGTFKEGILVVRNWQDQKNVSSLSYSGIVTSPNNEVFLSTRKGEIYKDDNGPQLHLKKDGNIDELFYLNNTYSVGDNQISEILFSDTDYEEVLFRTFKDLVEIDNNFVIWTDGVIIGLVFKNQQEFISPKFAKKRKELFYNFYPKKRCRSVHYVKNEQRIYYSTNSGLFSKKWNTSITKPILFEGKAFLGNDLEVFQNNLIVATEEKGLLFYHSGKFIGQLTLKDGLSSNTVLKIKLKDNFLFLLTKNGLQVYDLLKQKFKEIGLNEGLIADRVINFSLSKDKLWILDKEGYYSIELSNLNSDKSIEIGNIYLDSVIFSNDKINIRNQTTFSYDQNQLRIYFDYRDIETKNETKIYYKLEGVSKEWQILDASSNSIEFPILPPGSYTFYLRAKFRDQETKTIEYSFKISPPFWLTWWFTALCILAGILFVSLLFFIQMKRLKRARLRELKEQKLQTDVFDSQLKAIRSQMNPHFIFNSLNSIQALVLRQDTEKSYDYIVMFSDLVRKTLHFSEQEYISVKEEMDFLEIYLKLEALRMKEDFSYSIEIKGTDSIQIPSLLIQPFLENSIHHGLLHKEGKKDLTVIYECVNDSASCTITDNGIGRSEAEKINERQKASHTSFSLQAVNQRLRILSEQNGQSYSYQIEDLFDSSGNPAGTKITVDFPFNHDY